MADKRTWVRFQGMRLSTLVEPGKHPMKASSLRDEKDCDEHGELLDGTSLAYTPWAIVHPDGTIRKGGKKIGTYKDLVTD